LTLTSGLAVTTADVTGASTIYLTPYKGKSVSLYTGSAWVVYTVAELSIATSGGTASKPHDVFLDENGGTPALAILTWTNTTTRATALTVQDGVLVKTGDTSQRYMGTVYLDSSKNCDDSLTFRSVWNYYNRVARPMQAFEPADSWTYTIATWRYSRGNAANALWFVIGVSEDQVDASAQALATNGQANVGIYSGIGLDSSSAVTVGTSTRGWLGPVASHYMGLNSEYHGFPGIGNHQITWLEKSEATNTTTWLGDVGQPADFQTGIQGTILG